MIITGITVYELLGLIKDGQAPKKVKYRNEVLYYDEESKDYYNDEDMHPLFARANTKLDKEVEIIEEKNKIPEKLEEFDIQGIEVSGYSMTQAEYLLEDGVKENRKMINLILDYLKSKGK